MKDLAAATPNSANIIVAAPLLGSAGEQIV